MAFRLQTFGIFCFLIVLFLLSIIQIITTKQLKNIKSSMTLNGRRFNGASAQNGWRKRKIEETIEPDNLIANQQPLLKQRNLMMRSSDQSQLPPSGQPPPNVPRPKTGSSNAQDGFFQKCKRRFGGGIKVSKQLTPFPAGTNVFLFSGHGIINVKAYH